MMGIFESFDEDDAVSTELEAEDVTPELGSSDDEEPEGDEATRKIYQKGRVVAPEYDDTLLQEAARLLAEAGLHNDAAALPLDQPRMEVLLERADALSGPSPRIAENIREACANISVYVMGEGR